jgi:hypothetical protein
MHPLLANKMPSAGHDLFIMGFIHIYKFASNKCSFKTGTFYSSQKKIAT